MSVTEEELTERMRDVVDPELGINVVDLGLVYSCELGRTDDGRRRAGAAPTGSAPAPAAGRVPRR